MKIPVNKIKRGDAVVIIWIDAHYSGDKGWQEEVEFMDKRDGMEIKSVCQFLGHDEEYVYTAADRSVEGEKYERGIMRDFKIPIGCIKKMRRLK